MVQPWNNGKSGAKLDLTSSTTPGLQIHTVDHTRTANLCDWLAMSPCRAPIGQLSPLPCLFKSPSCWRTHFLYLSDPPPIWEPPSHYSIPWTRHSPSVLCRQFFGGWIAESVITINYTSLLPSPSSIIHQSNTTFYVKFLSPFLPICTYKRDNTCVRPVRKSVSPWVCHTWLQKSLIFQKKRLGRSPLAARRA